jgi:hypothetical protein
MVEVITDINSIREVLPEIYETGFRDPNLTPRSLETLGEIANKGDLVLIKVDDKVAGWGIREVLTKNFKEIGMMFIKPEYRSPGAFIALARGLADDPSSMVLATYDKALIRQAVLEFNFREVGLLEVIIRSRGRFITKRLTKASREAVTEHRSQGKALFAIRGKQ